MDLGVFVGHDIELALISDTWAIVPRTWAPRYKIVTRVPTAGSRREVMSPESAASGSADEDRRVGGDRDGGGALGLGDPTRLRCGGEATIARQLLTADRHDA